jgi:hypothetical protein
MDHFLFFYQSPGASLHSASPLSKAVKRFCKDKKIQHIQGESYQLYWENIEDTVRFSINLESGMFFCGRDAKKFTDLRDISKNLEQCVFPYVRIHFGEIEGSLEVTTDPFGLFSYFYSVLDGQFIVTNYLPAIMHYWQAQLQIDRDAQHELLMHGTLGFGKTLFKQIQMSHVLYNIEVKNFSEILVKEKKSKSSRSRQTLTQDSEQFYQEFRSSVRSLLEYLPIYWITLTGGADSRLILSTLSREFRAQQTFLFDNIAADTKQIPFDQKVVELLKMRYGLWFQYGFPQSRQNHYKPFIGSQPESSHNFILTGLFGGEIVGGQALCVQPKILNSAQEREVIKKKCRDYIQSDSDLFYCVSLMTSSFVSFFYNDKNWRFPFAVTQKKITPFLNTQLMRILFSQNDEDLVSFVFYQEIYRNHASEFMRDPFHSMIARSGAKDFLDINNSSFQHIAEQENNEILLHERQNMIDEILNLLREEVSF